MKKKNEKIWTIIKKLWNFVQDKEETCCSKNKRNLGSLTKVLLCRRTWMMLAEEFLSSGPTHCSIKTPSLYSPRKRPSKTSTGYCGARHLLPSTAGHPPSFSSTPRNGASPNCFIWPENVVSIRNFFFLSNLSKSCGDEIINYFYPQLIKIIVEMDDNFLTRPFYELRQNEPIFHSFFIPSFLVLLFNRLQDN